MAGNWTLADIERPSQRPGIYTRFLSSLNINVFGPQRGTVGIASPVSWGTRDSVIVCNSLSDYTDVYTNWIDTVTPVTTLAGKALDPYMAVQNAFIGGARRVLFYGIPGATGSTGAAASYDVPTVLVTFTANQSGLYGNRLKVTITTPTSGSNASKVVVTLDYVDPSGYVEDLRLRQWVSREDNDSFGAGNTPTAEDLIDIINNDEENVWITMSKTTGWDDVTANNNFAAANSNLEGGSDPTPSAAEWSNAIDNLLQENFTHLFVNGDPTNQSGAMGVVSAKVQRVRNEGSKFVWVTGSANGATAANAIAGAGGHDDEGIVYVHPGFQVNDGRVANVNNRARTLSGAAVASRVAGLLAGLPLVESATRRPIPGQVTDLNIRHSHSDIASMLAAGVMPLIYDGRRYRIERGLNTLTTLGTNQNNQFKKVKVVSILDSIQTSIETSLNDQVIGRVLNDIPGRRTVLSGIRTFFNRLVEARLINGDFVVREDPDYPPIGDRFFIQYAIRPIDSIEYVYNTVEVNT